MIALVQRVSQAHVVVDDAQVGSIGRGLLVFVCAQHGDDEAVADRLVSTLLGLRVFADEQGRMNLDLEAIGGDLLVVPQFTLAADTRHGHRPGFAAAAPAELGRRLYDHAVQRARVLHPRVQCGVFGADMKVHLVNDGPVTIPITLH